MDSNLQIGIIGAGTMGSGLAQVAATNGAQVLLYDSNPQALTNARQWLRDILDRLVAKQKIEAREANAIFMRVTFCKDVHAMADANICIEAVIEDLDVKKDLFRNLENIVPVETILATNTSSLSVTSIAGACESPDRIVGMHFFNPPALMKLVEIIPAVQTDSGVVTRARSLVEAWGKTAVVAKDTPGFIVNRVARPFYSEALRIVEEGLADVATVDYAMTEIAGFRMGPFALMDYIGNDVNYAVTKSVWEACHYEPRYKPALTQKQLVDAGYLGRKSGRGYYEYGDGSSKPAPSRNPELLAQITDRIVIMLINEATDALFWNIASKEDIDLAMTQGVNYPKGLLRWADEIGVEKIVETLDRCYAYYHEERYRTSPLLRAMHEKGESFYT